MRSVIQPITPLDNGNPGKSFRASLQTLLLGFSFAVGFSSSIVQAQTASIATSDLSPVIPIPTLAAAFVDQRPIAEIVVDMEQRWKTQYGDHLNLVFPDRAVTPEHVAQTLQQAAAETGTRAGFIWISPYENYLTLTLITPDEEPVYVEVPVQQRNLFYTAREFVQSVTDPISFRGRHLRVARPLHDWLVAPLEETLKARNIDTLIFCLGGGLRTLPLAALHDGDQFLVEKYTIARVPAFALADLAYQPLKDAQVLAMGASQFADQFPLPAVELELETIVQDIWPGTAFLNQTFTQENLQAQRQQTPFEIIHLATHADFRAGDLSNSYIQLWDSRLTLDQIGQFNFRSPLVELLVLSACRTAIGDREAELGFAGLAAKAGVRSVLASLWYVSDAGTLALMTEFYRQLKIAPTKAQALRQAQIAMIQGEVRVDDRELSNLRGNPLPADLIVPYDENFAHPYYWAAFTMVGNPW